MRRELADLIGSGLLLLALGSATVGAQSMPDLDLTDEEIEALTAFLLAPDPN